MQRKRYTMEFKQQVPQEAMEVGNIAQVARRYGLVPKIVYDWIKKSNHQGWQITSTDAKKVSTYVPSLNEFKELETENNKLKKILGEKIWRSRFCETY